VRLIKRYLEPGATGNYVQVGHHQTAVEYAIAGIKQLHDANLAQLGRDPFNSEMEGTMRAWVVESLVQGAYLREYHLWEKDCKAYFTAMAERNGATTAMKPRGGQSFPELVKETLVSYDVTFPAHIFDAIGRMRDQVNVMKHEAGLEPDHFINESDYAEAVTALEGFWAHLAGCERVAA
jgi:hypothetical protein